MLSRDFDACITLTPHAVEAGAIVVDVLLRNYAPQEPFTIVWGQSQETGGYCFDIADDMLADKKTSRTKAAFPGYESYLPAAEAILIAGTEMDIAYFKNGFKEKTALSDSRIKDFINWATLDKNPQMTTREQRGRGINKKWISMTSSEVRHD